MRRGYRNRWTRDNNPHDQGIVTVPKLFEAKHYATTEELSLRDKTSGTVARLYQYGLLGPSFGPNPNYVPRTYKRQELPAPLHPNGL